MARHDGTVYQMPIPCKIGKSAKWVSKYRVWHIKITARPSRIQIWKNYFDNLKYVKLFIFLYHLCLLWRHLSGNVSSGATISRLSVGARQKLHFVNARWRDRTMAHRYTKILIFTFSLPFTHTRVQLKLINSPIWYFIHNISPVWGYLRITVRQCAMSAKSLW